MITSADKEVDNDVITFHSVFGDDDVDDYDNDGDDDDDAMTMIMLLLLLLMMMMMTTTTMKKYVDDEGDIDGSTTTDEGHVNSWLQLFEVILSFYCSFLSTRWTHTHTHTYTHTH